MLIWGSYWTKKRKNRKVRYEEVIEGKPIYSDYKYVAFTKDKESRREVILIDDLDIPNGSVEIYSSYLRYPSDFQLYWTQNNRSVAKYNGSCYSDFLPIDLDSEDLSDAQVECQHLISLLVDQYEVNPDCLGVYFSGSKGFHIEIPTFLFGNIKPSPNLPYIFKEIPKILDIKYHDTSIYNRNALWRFPNTINAKSGLYKIPLFFNQINNLTIDDIKSLATKPVEGWKPVDYEDWDSTNELVDIWAKAEEKNRERKKPAKEYIFIGKGENNSHSHEGVSEGNRNNRAFEIAQELKAKGLKVNEVKDYIVNEWNPKNKPPEKNIQSLYRTVESVYSYSLQYSGSVEVLKHLRTDPYYNSMKPIHKAIYIDIICNLNEVDKIAFQKFNCKPNQLVFSYRRIAERVGIKENQVRTVIKKLKEWGRISVEVLKEDGMMVASRLTFACFK